MFRLTLMCLALAALAEGLPQGCPALPSAAELPPAERGSITTTATAPPTASAGDAVALLATATADLDGGGIAYSWLQAAGAGVQIQNATQANASFTAPSLRADQTLSFVVTTRNERGDVGRAAVDVRVLADPNFGQTPANGPSATRPVASAGADHPAATGSTVTLDGSASRGTGLTYHWSQVSGTSVTLSGADTVSATFTAPAFDPAGANALQFELEVRDSRGRTANALLVITVIPSTTEAKPRVVFKTSMGDFMVELNRTQAPLTVNNFLQYADDQFYSNTIFHRVIKDFVIQGGGFIDQDGQLVQKDTRAAIVNESGNGLKNVRGTIAMARTNDPNSATSQFFINLVDNANLDYQTGQPGYAVFGQVVDGMSVVDAIGAVATGARQGFNDVPLQDVVLQSIERIAATSQSTP